MSIINKHKWGDCSQCGDKDVPCAKVGKNLFCIAVCHKGNKIKAQIAKSNQKQAVRSLGTYQKQEGIVDSIQELTIDLDRVVSRYVRLRDMETDEKITCYCCDKRIHWTKAECMHFIDRRHKATRWLLENLRSGCFTCNNEKKGNLKVYGARLNKENPGIVELLTEQQHSVSNTTRTELKELLIMFQQKLKMVEIKLKK